MQIKILYAFVLSLLFAPAAKAQLILAGPDCVTTGTVYQYLVQGIKTNDKLKLCVKGGTIVDRLDNCLTDSLFSYVRVVWKENVSSGSITLSTSSGEVTKTVTVSLPLSPGSISSNLKKQDIEYGTLPVAIICSAASGGSCTPSYTYQWQKSADGISWIDFVGAKGQSLAFSLPLTQTAYFRRKVKEVTSNSEAYSNEVVVYVGIDKKSLQ